jgi:5'-3' exonuclease
MKSTKPAPYVYIGTNKRTGEFYIGCRWRNYTKYNRISSDDLGIEYFSSGKTTKERFNEFDWVIIAEFFGETPHIDAYKFEQELIYENWNVFGLLNKHHQHGTPQWKQIDHKFSDDTLTNISNFQKNLWRSLTEVEKRQRKEKELESKRNRTDIRQKEVFETASNAKKEMHKNMTSERKAAMKAKELETKSNKSKEENYSIVQKFKETHYSKSEEELDVWKEKLRLSAIEQHKNTSDEEKAESIRKQLETKANKTDEERAAYSQRLKDVAAKRTPEKKAAIKAKELETRRLNKLKKLEGCDEYI